MKIIGNRPIYPFRFGCQWQACQGDNPIGPIRLFQRDAINDLPDAAGVHVNLVGHYCSDMAYRVKPVMQFGERMPWHE